MVELLEKRLGDVVAELEAERKQIQRELHKVDSQLELIKNLLKGSGGAGKATGAKGKKAEAPDTTKKAEPTTKRKVGRPKKAKAKKTSTAAPKGKPGRKAKSANGKTLKEELLAIAKANGGKFTIKEASLQLVKSGRYFTTEKAAANIHSAIATSKGAIKRDSKERGLYHVKG